MQIIGTPQEMAAFVTEIQKQPDINVKTEEKPTVDSYKEYWLSQKKSRKAAEMVWDELERLDKAEKAYHALTQQE